MSAYMVVELEVTDAEAYAAYSRLAVPMIQRFGGQVLAASDAVTALEGEPARRLIIIAFESDAQARTFYESPEYQTQQPLRVRAARSRLLLVPGL